MPSVKAPKPTHFDPVKPTSEKLEYANLATIDFSLLKDGEEGKTKLTETLNHAMRDQGFFYIINHGLSEEEITRQVDIGYTVLTETPLEEKISMVSEMQEKGQYRGFKLRDYYQYPPPKFKPIMKTSKRRRR
jgi:isopenicillin N synthase-like dioxygenase